MDNGQYAALLDEIADLTELAEGGGFRTTSYHNAARTVRDLPNAIEPIAREGTRPLAQLPGIGASTARDLVEMAESGTCRRLEDLRAEVPPGVRRMMQISGVGPRTAMQIFRELGVEDVEQLRQACEAQRVRALPRLGAKSEARILDGIRVLEAVADRTPLIEAQRQVDLLTRALRSAPAIDEVVVAGSFRRRRETVGDLDILVRSRDRGSASTAIHALPDLQAVIGEGPEKISLRLISGLQVDLRFVEDESLGAALLYFTGSKAHNVTLRQWAREQGWKLNEYGLYQDGERIAGASEEEVYAAFDLPWIAPELREDRGELAAARAEGGGLPDLIAPGAIRGDLHAHTTASDGQDDIRTMADAARKRGYSYLAITDHSKALTVANGLDEDRLLRQAETVREIDAGLSRFWLLAGVEVDILADGSLDLDPAVLASLDWVIASIHSHFQQDAATMTERLLRAIRSGVVHCLGHPFGRLLGRREAVDFDRDAVFAACHEHGVACEINANPHRLDLPDTAVRQAIAAGVDLVIDTDAHRASNLDFMPLGLDIARRGWAERDDILNTLTIPQLRRRLQRR